MMERSQGSYSLSETNFQDFSSTRSDFSRFIIRRNLYMMEKSQSSYSLSETNFQDFSSIRTDFSRALKFTFNPYTPKISFQVFQDPYEP